MTAGTHQSHSDWEEQLELLSAYLDDEVTERERAALEEHLPTCEECRQALQELRQSRSLLYALAEPALPRSFLLPLAGAIPEPLSRERRGTAGSTASDQRARVRRARTLQWIGGLVAALGLFLLVTTTGPHTLSTATSVASGAQVGQAGSAHVPNGVSGTQVPSAAAGGSNSPNQLDRSTPTITATPAAAPAATATAARPAYTTVENVLPLGPLAGVTLFLSGTSLLVGATILIRRRPRRQL